MRGHLCKTQMTPKSSVSSPLQGLPGGNVVCCDKCGHCPWDTVWRAACLGSVGELQPRNRCLNLLQSVKIRPQPDSSIEWKGDFVLVAMSWIRGWATAEIATCLDHSTARCTYLELVKLKLGTRKCPGEGISHTAWWAGFLICLCSIDKGTGNMD